MSTLLGRLAGRPPPGGPIPFMPGKPPGCACHIGWGGIMGPCAEPHGPMRCGGGMLEDAVDGLLVVGEAPAELLGGGGIWNAGGGIMPGHGCIGGGSSGGGAEDLGELPEVPGGGGGGGM